DTPLSTVSPGEAAKAYTSHRGSVVSRHKISNPARSRSSPASQLTFASGVTAPVNVTLFGGAGAIANCRNASALYIATLLINAKFRYFRPSPYSTPFSVRGV